MRITPLLYVYYSYYFRVPAPSFAGSLHTNPGPVQSGLTGHSNAKNTPASGSDERHAE